MSSRIIYYDTETTGLSVKDDHIIEIAGYDLVDKRTFVQLMNPGRPIPPSATAIHKISNDMVEKAPSIKEGLQGFFDFCTADAILIAHNNDAFDMRFLRAEAERQGLVLPEFRYIDSLKWARKYRPDLPTHTLQSLRALFGICANQAHRALDDVLVLAEVFSLLVGDLSWETILRLMDTNGPIRRMPFGKYKNKRLEEVPSSYLTWLASSGALDKEENRQLKESLGSILSTKKG